jgi:hypothetical protein
MLFFNNGLEKKIAERTIKIIWEVIIMRYVELYIARCFPNILDVMVLENVNLSEDKIGRPPLWSSD